MAPTLTLRTAVPFSALSALQLHRIAALRQIVFVVEQHCPYLDLDGRDLDATTLQFWAEDEAGEVVSSLRVMHEHAPGDPELYSIGRVVTSPPWRGRGVAAQLLRAALAHCGDAAVMLHAQSQLIDWYARFGFQPVGDDFLEDDIPHRLMRREAAAQ